MVALLNGIEARRQMSDPHSLLNRPPVLWFKGVTGAPGDGNTSLRGRCRRGCPTWATWCRTTAKGAISRRGPVKTAPGAGKTTRIEIQWIVNDAQGRERGRVVQLNEVPIGIAGPVLGRGRRRGVANEAAGGVHEVVVQASGRGSKPDGKPAANHRRMVGPVDSGKPE